MNTPLPPAALMGLWVLAAGCGSDSVTPATGMRGGSSGAAGDPTLAQGGSVAGNTGGMSAGGSQCIPGVDLDCNCQGFVTRRITPQSRSFAGVSMVWNADEERFALAWAPVTGGFISINFAELDRVGTKLGTDLLLSHPGEDGLSPFVAWNGSEYGVLWSRHEMNAPTGALFSTVTTGGAVSPAVNVGGIGAGGLVRTESGFAAVVGGAAPDSELSLVWLDAAGVPEGAAVAISPPGVSSTQPTLVWNGSELAVAWRDFRTSDWEVYLARFAPGDTASISGDVRVTDDPRVSAAPSLAYGNGAYAVAWEDNQDEGAIYYALFGADGARLTANARVDTAQASSLRPKLVWNGTEFMLIWASVESANPLRVSLWVSGFDASGSGLREPELVTDQALGFESVDAELAAGTLTLLYEEASDPWLALAIACRAP